MYCRDSVYEERFKDEEGLFFDKEAYPELEGETRDVSGILQKAICDIVDKGRYGILYIPEGEYPICKTVKIPPAVRLIGYGKRRPVFYIPDEAEGFPSSISEDYWEKCVRPKEDLMWMSPYPGAHYMFWFIGEPDCMKENPLDAHPGTFYSAISNIDFRVDGNHPTAVCVRAHFAQHGFLSHCHFELGSALAGLFDVGNEMDNLTFEGGDYGIICRTCSPGWPFVLTDSVFNNQRKAAVRSSMTGFTGIRLSIKNTLTAFDSYIEGTWEKLYLEDCYFENINTSVIKSFSKKRVTQQTNAKNITCKNVACFVYEPVEKEEIKSESKDFFVKSYTCGYEWTNKNSLGEFVERIEYGEMPEAAPKSDIPLLPKMSEWKSVKEYGAFGDGKQDDTDAIKKAIMSEKVLYFPQGIYKISDSLVIEKDISFIGMSPISTQIIIENDTPSFCGFGTAKGLIDVAKGVRFILNGIGIDCNGKNPRAAGVVWRASADSYMNDVKFVGGHGIMNRDGKNAFDFLYNASRTADYDATKEWDYQYPGLWIMSEGGGTFKDIWSASPYHEAGLAIDNTSTTGRMYCVSLEHHVRSEMKMHNVKNWKFYALQTEEEKAEGSYCLPLEMVSCKDLCFANFFLFRVVAVDQTYETGIRTWNCDNVEICNLYNKAQMQYTFLLAMKDESTGAYAKAAEYGHILVTKKEASDESKVMLGSGFNFAQGACLDEDGNLYWCDKLKKRIYKYSKELKETIPVLDIHYKPAALFVRGGYMFIAVDYQELREKEEFNPFKDHDRTNPHPFFTWFYKRSERTYVVDLSNPYDTMVIPEKISEREAAKYLHVRPMELDYPGAFGFIASKPVSEYLIAKGTDFVVESTIDLARTIRLGAFEPGKPFYVTDDSAHQTLLFETDELGDYKECTPAALMGQYGSFTDKDGITWVVDDGLYGYKDGKVVERKEVPMDVYTIIGNDKDIYLIGRNAIYLYK